MLRTSFRHLSVALIALAVVSVVGCAGERDPINRVQLIMSLELLRW